MATKFPKRIELKLTQEEFDNIEKYRIYNQFEDKQDCVRYILNKELNSKSFFEKIKDLFR